MGVSVREKVKGSGVWWVFVKHKGQRTSSMIGSESAAEKVKGIVQAQLKLGQYVFPKKEEESKQPTLEAYYRKFERTYLQAACRESTAERYEECFRIHILPALGTIPLDAITREQVKDLIADLVAKGLARATIRIITDVFRAVMNHAIEDKLISANPGARVGKFFKNAKVRHEEIQPLSAEEVPIFLETTARHSRERYPLFLCAIHTGLRSGELAGLKWNDIDWNGKFLMVRRSISKTGKVTPTKTAKIRRVDMSDALLAELAGLRRQRREEYLKNGKNEIPDWTFSSRAETPLDMHNVKNRDFVRCLEKAGLRRIRFHDLRHTFASLLIQNGESLVYVKEQLGHSSIKVTVDIYGHLIPGANRQAVNRLPSLESANRHPMGTLENQRL
jgi:integrase